MQHIMSKKEFKREVSRLREERLIRFIPQFLEKVNSGIGKAILNMHDTVEFSLFLEPHIDASFVSNELHSYLSSKGWNVSTENDNSCIKVQLF